MSDDIDPDHTIVVGIIDHDFRYPYGDPLTYQLGAEYLEPCATIEDWGCGRGYFSRYVSPDRYTGVDMGVDSVPGDNPFANVNADLTTYRSSPEGIFMRHVLEHNHAWEQILHNALASATRRLFIAVFTPWSNTPDHEVIAVHGPPEYPIYEGRLNPNIAFNRERLLDHFGQIHGVAVEEHETGTQYGAEHIIKVDMEARP